jgi:hypothetical protein
MSHSATTSPRKGVTSGAFWVDLLERSASTAAGAALAYLVTFGGLAEVDYAQLGSVVGLATAVSVLKALVASYTGDGSASLVK